MTTDEAIKHCEEVMMENLEKTKDRNACDPIAISCGECADNHRQLAEWLKELQAHREAWEKVKSELWMEGMNMAGEYQGVWVRYRDIERVIDTNRPKESDTQ